MWAVGSQLLSLSHPKNPCFIYISIYVCMYLILGYDRPLPFPSISLTPDTTMSFNLQTSEMQTQSRGSTVVIGEIYLDRSGEILTEVERIHEESQALPFAIYDLCGN